GKSQLDSKSGYRTARYRLPDGGERETAYFGLALAEYLQAQRVILLGTASSMWDLLVENVVGDAAQEELRVELMEAVRHEAVSETLLAQLTPALERTVGRPVQALVIPHAVAFSDQQELLARLADLVGRGESVALDLTHGYRHLAMLGLAAARYLAHERQVVITGLYYGALDMTREGITPVITLEGLAHILEWSEAFAAYESSGDFSRFAPLLERDGFPAEAAQSLRRGWDFLVLSNVQDAARQLRSALPALERPLKGASELYRARLRKALRWAEPETLHEKQRLLALQALERGDILRATVFGLESFISREVAIRGGDVLNYKEREKVEDAYQEMLRQGEQPDWKRAAYWLLKNVRNACTHGTPPTYPPHAELVKNPERLRRELRATLDRLISTA
ncbi:MAG: TIGR02221 family CRISPR-associated protein, partial [Burkholderiales bacterium]|nr:TIGR02221 family CRISPR-associated protein [Burkholderiales bacterium]